MPPVASPDMPKPIEAMAAAAKKDISLSVAKPELRAAVKRGQELRKVEQDGLKGRALLEAARRGQETSFDAQQRNSLQLKFGGGLAEDMGGGRIDIDPTKKTSNPEAGVMFDASKAAIDKASSMLIYTDVLVKGGDTPATQLKAYQDRMNNPLLTLADWNNARKDALTQIGNLQAVRESMPELFAAGISPAEQQAFLEATLAANPKLREAIASKLTTALEQAKGLPEVSDPAFDQLETDRTLIDTKLKHTYEGISSLLRANGYQDTLLLNPTKVTEIATALRSGQPEAVIRAKVYDAAIASQSWAELPQFRVVDAAKAEVARIKEELKGVKPGSALETTLDNQLIAAQMQLTFQEGTLSTAGKTEYQRYLKLNEQFAQQGGAAGKGGDVNQELMSLVASGKDYKQKTDEIALKKPDHDKKIKEQMADRLRQESTIAAGLENILEDAVSDVMESEYDEVIPLRQQELEAQAEKMKSEVGKKITEAMGKNWIEFNQKDRKKEVHKDKIGADVRMLAYKGNEGVQRLLLRDLGEANWETIDLAKLNPKMREKLDEAKTTYGDAYRDRLMTDFFAARGIWEKAGLKGKLHLKDHEWEQLERNFGEQMTESLNKSKHGKEALDRLKAAGFEPKGKKKWLLYILAMLGAGAIGVALGPGAGVLAGAGALGGAVGLEG